MFNKLFKKESTKTLEDLSGVPETISEQIQEEQLPTNLAEREEGGDAVLEYEGTLPMSETELAELEHEFDAYAIDSNPTSPIDDDDFNAEFDVPDVGVVDDIDEDALRAELQDSIKQELMSEENLDAVEERAEMMETEMGITQHEWDTKYNNIEMIGYETREQQALVFSNVLPKEYDPFTESVLDVGCGVGDLYAYVQEVLEAEEPIYAGIDMDPEMIELAKGKFPEVESDLSVTNILELESNKKWDWVVAMSAFNVKVDNIKDMTEYAKLVINKMYSLSEKGIAINLMHSFPKGEDWSDTMTTFNSTDIYTWAIDNFYNVKAHRNYIDRDFILYIYK
jgi:SAM-dependent methyltransferase